MNLQTPRVYIAGPISGRDWKQTKTRFKDAQRRLEEAGYEVSNPCDHQIESGTWGDYMRQGIKAMMDCDAIFVFDDWSESKGACIEYNLARQLGMGVLYESALNKH